MNNGWVKLHRGILEWEWYDDINTSRLFLHLLIIANHKDKNWRGILIKKGQKLTSQIKLADETGLTRQQVRTSLDKLKSTNDITITTSAQSTVVTMVNWDKYQNQPAEQPTDNQRATNEQPTDNQRVTTNKKDKNEKNSYPAGINPDLLTKISEAWNIKMVTQPQIKLLDQTQVNKKRWAKIKKIVIDNPDYLDCEYWEGHIDQLSTLPDLQWQRDNKQLTFDQVTQIDKFERNLGLMRMGQ